MVEVGEHEPHSAHSLMSYPSQEHIGSLWNEGVTVAFLNVCSVELISVEITGKLDFGSI